MAAVTSSNNFAKESQPAALTSTTVYVPPALNVVLFQWYGNSVPQIDTGVALFVTALIVAVTVVLAAEIQAELIFLACA